jgi:hypothetical protein
MGHAYVNMSFVIIPSKVYTEVEMSVPILFELIVLAECVNEVVRIMSSNIFNTEIIDSKGKLHRPGDMFPQSRRVGHLIVSMWA